MKRRELVHLALSFVAGMTVGSVAGELFVMHTAFAHPALVFGSALVTLLLTFTEDAVG